MEKAFHGQERDGYGAAYEALKPEHDLPISTYLRLAKDVADLVVGQAGRIRR